MGQQFQTVSRTITESDVITFAGLLGDFNQPDTGEEFARNTPYARRIAHGLPGMTIASGIATRGGNLEVTALAYREINNW
jgi:acyl dehydratase